MTAITKADIPANITTLEQLATWCALALSGINPTVVAVEGVGISERACQTNFFYINASDKNRLLCRLSIELDPLYTSGGQKIWMYAQPFSETDLPASFKA